MPLTAIGSGWPTTILVVRGRVNALLVAVVAGVFAIFVASQVLGESAARWQAEARVVVLPANSDPTYEAVYYETLSRGQVVLTMAEVIRGTSSEALDRSS